MVPSTAYESTEQTSSHGFKYYTTNNTIKQICPLRSEVDYSIAYTQPDNNINTLSMFMLKGSTGSAYIHSDTWFAWNYYKNAQHTQEGYMEVVEIAGDDSLDEVSSYVFPLVTFAENSGAAYTFGKSSEATSAISDSFGDSAKFVTDFDINKIIFQCEINGLTTAEVAQIKAAGSQVVNEHRIYLEDLIANPNNYMITGFKYTGNLVWGTDNSWRTGETSIKPVWLIDGDEISAVAGYGNALGGDGQTILGWTYRKSQNMIKQSRDENILVSLSGGTLRFAMSSEKNCVIGNQIVLDLKPDMDANAMEQLITTQVTPDNTDQYGDFYDIVDTDEVYGMARESWRVGLDYSGATTPYMHFTKYGVMTVFYLKGAYVCKMLAHAGIYAVDGHVSVNDLNNDGVTPTNLAHEKIFLGEMSDEFHTTGNWIDGEHLPDYEGPNKEGKVIRPDYNPNPPGPSGTDEDDTAVIPATGAPFATGLAHYYITTADSTVLQDISEAMSTWDIDTSKKDLYRNLISCKLVKPPAPVPSTPGLTFTIYGVAPEKDGSPITITGVAGNPTASFGPYSISRKFNDFRDYAPYSKAEIFLPYCGWCALPSHVIGRKVSVSYYTDIIAATCKAIVYCGANPVAEAAGVIGLDIPFAAENVGAKMEAANAGLLATASGGLQTAIGVGTMVATKGSSGGKQVMSGLSQYISGFSQMSMAANENWTEISGKTGDGCNIAGLRAIVIKITRPKYGTGNQAPTYTPSGFGHSIGYASMKAVTVGSVTGLLIADNVDTSGIAGATDRERQLIKNYLESGIIVNPAGE